MIHVKQAFERSEIAPYLFSQPALSDPTAETGLPSGKTETSSLQRLPETGKPMDYLIVALAACFGAGLTLFSGFGLGTLLLAVLVLIFPPGVAIVVTAVVHFLNNVFKFGLLGKHADAGIVLRFGLPAIAGAWLGAQSLSLLAGLPALFSYSIGATEHSVTPVKVAIGVLLGVFAAIELLPLKRIATIPPRFLPLGGALSGYFGGLSGHQGALRTLFLVKAGLPKETFIATGVAVALIIDITRISTYLVELRDFTWRENAMLIATATVAAFIGSFAASRVLRKVTMQGVQRMVAILLGVISAGLVTGIL